MTPDGELLRRYVDTGSEEAFGEVVRRHLDLVHSAALRQVNGDAHLAQDVAQEVFVDVARKARTLAGRPVLAGWLYTSARYAAMKAARSESRRRAREAKAETMQEPQEQSGPGQDWAQVRGALDEAMHELRGADREAILLRYFEGRQLEEVGVRLGLNGNAARMRVERALEKLRGALARRGVTTATALSAVLEANAVQTAPAGLAGTLTGVAVAAGGPGTGGMVTVLKVMATTNVKLGVTALVVAGLGAALIWQLQSAAELRRQNEALRQQMAQLKSANDELARQAAAKIARGLRLPAPAMQPVTGQNDVLEGAGTNMYDRIINGKVPKLTAAQLADFLKANHRDASSLLAAFRTTHDPALLREAMDKFPNDPQVGFEAAMSTDLTADERRQWMTKWEQTDPDNSLANYLSAANYMKNGQTDQAVQELIAASGKSGFTDYSVDRVEDDKQAYLGAGYNVTEAEMLATSQLMLPQLAQIKQLALGMADMSKSYQQAGDASSAQSALQMCVDLGERYATQVPGESTISQLVGIATEKIGLGAMDPNSPYGDTGETVQDELNQVMQQRAVIKARNDQVDPLLPLLTDNDWIIYKDLWMQSGETAAENWVIGKYGH
jgi:RNA polymerase sigma factor (sigma-70 family)